PFLDFVGLLPEPELRAFIDRICPSEADRLVREAATVENGRPAEAEDLYRRALAREPRHEAATLGLVRVLLARGRAEEAEKLLADAGFTGDAAAEAERLGAMLYLRRLGKEFGEEDAARRRLAEKPSDARPLYELGCVLAASGHYEEALEK